MTTPRLPLSFYFWLWIERFALWLLAWVQKHSPLGRIPSPFCEWTDDGMGNWSTSCGDEFTLIAEGPSENSMEFCPMCGKRIKAIAYTED